MRILSAALVAAAFESRHPNADVIDSIEAGTGKVEKVEAAAIRTSALPAGKLQYVKATSHFFIAGELVTEGDYVQVQKDVATRLIRNDQAVAATDEEVRAAESDDAESKPKGKK